PLGGHVAYNLLILLSFPFAGLAAYGLGRQLGMTRAGAAVAGIGFALVPARLGPLFGGQPAGFAAGFVPLVVWGLDLALVRGSAAGALLGGGAFFALATLEPHYTYLLAALAAVHALVRLVTVPGVRGRARALLVFSGVAALGAGWLLMLRQAFVLGSVADAGRSLGEVSLFSAGPAALRSPATYGGSALAVLAIAGLIGSRRGTRSMRLVLGAALAAGVLLSL